MPELIPPVITLEAPGASSKDKRPCEHTNPTTVTCWLKQTVLSTKWSDPGFTAEDNKEGFYSVDQVTVVGWTGTNPETKMGTIDLSTEKSDTPYRITYDVSDKSINKNKAITKTRLVYVHFLAKLQRNAPRLTSANQNRPRLACVQTYRQWESDVSR